MKTRRDHTPLLAGAALLSALAAPEGRAMNEALALTVRPSSPGGITSARISLRNPADVQSFSLKLAFASGGVLSLPAADWFVRGSYFPSAPFGPEPRVEANHSADGGARTRVLLDGFNPAGTSGNVGAVTLKVASTAKPAPGTPAVPADTQVVTLSGEFWSRSEQKLKPLAPVSVEFIVKSGDNDGDNIADNLDPDDDNDGTPDTLDTSPKDAAFRGSERVNATVNQDWKTVSLPTLFTNPVVIAGPPSYHEADGGVARIRSVADGGFETRFQEWEYLNGVHASETVPYLIVEARRWTMPDGSIWEAGTFNLDGTGSWKAQSFTQPFAKAPRLFLTVQSANDGAAVAVRARKLAASGFEAALFEQERDMGSGHGAETVGYLAIYSPTGSGTVNVGGANLPYLTQQPTVDERWTPLLSSSVMLQEEISLNPETNHGDEVLSALALGNQIYAQDTSSLDADPVAPRRKPPEYATRMEWGVVNGVSSNWATIPLAKTYSKPVIVVNVAQQTDARLGVVRQRNATSASFQARFQPWDYLLPAQHGPERIFYLVAEQGPFTLAGLKGEAGQVPTNKVLPNAAAITYAQPFAALPSLFSSVMTYANAEAVVTRIKSSALGNFSIAMQEQESKADGHPQETLGWVAIQKGTGSTSDGRRIQILDATASHLPATVAFSPPSTSRRFRVLLPSLSGSASLEPAVAAQKNLTPSQVQVYVQEEQSKDQETGHSPESLSVFVAE